MRFPNHFKGAQTGLTVTQIGSLAILVLGSWLPFLSSLSNRELCSLWQGYSQKPALCLLATSLHSCLERLTFLSLRDGCDGALPAGVWGSDPLTV